MSQIWDLPKDLGGNDSVSEPQCAPLKSRGDGKRRSQEALSTVLGTASNYIVVWGGDLRPSFAFLGFCS